jgi:hypothetical protein
VAPRAAASGQEIFQPLVVIERVEMCGQYENLEKCCGGKITPESISRFQRAMVEYETFMDHMRQLLAPGGMIIEIVNGVPEDGDD